MKRRDIQQMSDLACMILESMGNSDSITGNSDTLYDKEGQNLRLNDFKDGDKSIVMFYTKKISDTENDILHNERGPAIIFANDAGVYDINDDKLAFYFIQDKKVEGDDLNDIKNNMGIAKLNPAASNTSIF